MKIWQLVVAGIVVHLILFYSIFDIYFTSPLVHGMTPLTVPTAAPASRLVLFVTDGLRADKFFEPDEKGKSRAPYLRQVIETEGVWGVSHTRVPTESRPGHVALIAGFYEDVSAVAKGWKENPVDFDSVFNQSRQTWSWGSPDILPMFAKGASGGHVFTNCYSPDLEDFADSDMTRLDTWVFDHVKEFFASAAENKTLDKALRQDKNVLFLHLLGIDTHGHSNKPHSKEYLNNIRIVDRGIQETAALVNNFFDNDGKTAFVMTADHGMTDWGSHGAGHPQETLTPFVAWGPGIRGPTLTEHCGVSADTFCSDWRLDFVERTDMEQADIAPLMSYLIGIPLPVNSVGVLPIGALNASTSVKAEALLINARQILAQFEVKKTQIKDRTISAVFRPFRELEEDAKMQSLKHIQHLIDVGMSQDAIQEAHILIQQALQGLRYYQTYDRLFLGVSIALGFLGWMSYIIQLVVLHQPTTTHQPHHKTTAASVRPGVHASYVNGGGGSKLSLVILAVIVFFIVTLLYVQSLPLMYYVYCLLPVVLWYNALSGWRKIVPALRSFYFTSSPWHFFTACILCLIGLEITVQSFYRRELLSLGLLLISVWPFVPSLLRRSSSVSFTPSCWGWTLSCLLVACFPLMPVVGRNSQYGLVICSGVLACALGVFVFRWLSKDANTISKHVLAFQVFLVAISVSDVALTSWSVNMKQGLPWLCQITSWSILGVSPVLPLLTGTRLDQRLLSLGLSFFSVYILLSITYEGFFMLSLFLLLLFWIQMEKENNINITTQRMSEIDFVRFAVEANYKDHIEETSQRQVANLRRAFFFVFFIIVAFFGTGNIASINSFDPSSVYCFLTIFNPFVMGALMMLKNLIPFLAVTCALQAVQVVTQTPSLVLFLLVLVMSDVMGLHFFFLVQDHGSWLEIGTTISHYVIVMAMIIFLLILAGVSRALTCWRVPLSTKAGQRGEVNGHLMSQRLDRARHNL